MSDSRRILVAGLGNIFFGDDAFGVEVARRLMRGAPRDGVCVEDFGIRQRDLAYAMLDGYDVVIFVDAVSRGQPHGTLYLLELHAADGAPVEMNAHGVDLCGVLSAASFMGSPKARWLLVGCEPTPIDAGGISDGLSLAVAAAVDRAAEMVRRLVEEEFRRPRESSGSPSAATRLAVGSHAGS